MIKMKNKKQAYITTTETLYPHETSFDSVSVRLYGRTEALEPVTVTVPGFVPHFYTTRAAAKEVAPPEHEDLLGYEKTDVIPLSERFDDDPQELVRVNVTLPHTVRDMRKLFETTWAADTLFTERFRIDTGLKTGIQFPTEKGRAGDYVADVEEIESVEMTDVEPRVVTLDIETDDRDSGFPSPGDARILSIAVYDSYDDEYEVFLDLDGQRLDQFFGLTNKQTHKFVNGELSLANIGVTKPDSLRWATSEREMLTSFADYIERKNPDIITGWNSGDESNDGFDLPHIIERMKGSGAPTRKLSRESTVEVDEYRGNYNPNIGGRALYDLMDGWGDTKFSEPESFRLDDVAEDVLDDAKIDHEEQGYFEMYQNDPVKFVNYNVKDTALTVRINDKEGILPFKKRLKDIVGVDWRRTHQNNQFIEMAVRRKCNECGVAMITAYDNPYVGDSGDSDEVNYEGAYVFPSFRGVKKNIVGIDLESLYPRTQQMLNASPDTRIEKGRALVEGIPFVEGENGQAFRTDVDGIMRELIEEYMELKAAFKQERNEAEPGTARRGKLAEAYNVTKTIVNSFYGYGGWNRAPLYNPHDAAAITLTGQAVIKRTAEYVDENTPGKVAYGDTDSTYIAFPPEWGQVQTLEFVDDLCDTLNNEVYPELCRDFDIEPENNRWRMDIEKLGTMFMSGAKKRYVTKTRWSEGMDFNEVLTKQ